MAAQEYCQTGKASYYANKFEGNKTASGVIFHNDSMFCAHKRLKFGTLLEVTNPRNNRTVIVKVVDRGPYIRGRIIDLSQRAARQLDIIAQGVAKVHVCNTKRIICPFRLSREDLILRVEFKKPDEHFDGLHPKWREIKALVEE